MLLFEFLNLDLRNGGRIGQAPADFLLAALRESGYEPPNPATDRDILAQVDRVIETIGERDQRRPLRGADVSRRPGGRGHRLGSHKAGDPEAPGLEQLLTTDYC